MVDGSLVLGTVQLGLDYGVANASGRPSLDQAAAIVARAWSGGVREFDTAQAYGESEAVLGHALAAAGIAGQARVLSKLHPALDPLDRAGLERAVRGSLERLGVPGLDTLMLHAEGWLDRWDAGLGEGLLDLRRAGLANRLGVSVYTPARALQALRTEGLDLVQLPANLLDRRFAAAGVLDLARDLGKAVHVRGVFLQGLFFLDPAALPPGLEPAAAPLVALRGLARDLGRDMTALALGYARLAHPGAGILVGVETADQLAANLDAFAKPLPADLPQQVARLVGELPEAVLNPVRWPKREARA